MRKSITMKCISNVLLYLSGMGLLLTLINPIFIEPTEVYALIGNDMKYKAAKEINLRLNAREVIETQNFYDVTDDIDRLLDFNKKQLPYKNYSIFLFLLCLSFLLKGNKKQTTESKRVDNIQP